jgi:hypothetical protein
MGSEEQDRKKYCWVLDLFSFYSLLRVKCLVKLHPMVHSSNEPLVNLFPLSLTKRSSFSVSFR